jgi:UDP-3-O-[3-hydroxymyristoyl] glucosamine N-acyltransferase
VGGKAGVADHVIIGNRVRLAGMTGATRDLEEGRDYGGIPARPIREWHKETTLLAKLARKAKRNTDE